MEVEVEREMKRDEEQGVRVTQVERYTIHGTPGSTSIH